VVIVVGALPIFRAAYLLSPGMELLLVGGNSPCSRNMATCTHHHLLRAVAFRQSWYTPVDSR